MGFGIWGSFSRVSAQRPTLSHVLRWICLSLLVVSLTIPSATLADDSSAAQQPEDTAEPAPPPAPTGPTLQASDTAPVICDPAKNGFRFLEIRGTGFDAWATKRLVGNLVDARGVAQVQWGSVWVSPQGRLTLEVNLCRDPFRGRPALAAGDYTVAIGPRGGQPIAATSVSLAVPTAPEAAAPDLEGDPAGGLPGTVTAPSAGPGSRQQPLFSGASARLADGWQFVVSSVTPDAWELIHGAISSTQPAAPDQRYVLIGVQAIYSGQGSGVLSAIRFGLVGKSGQQYDQLKNSCGLIPDSLPPTLIAPGAGIAGNVCFSVPSGDVDGLLLFDSQSNEADRTYFALR